jgi:hypothetical protein
MHDQPPAYPKQFTCVSEVLKHSHINQCLSAPTHLLHLCHGISCTVFCQSRVIQGWFESCNPKPVCLQNLQPNDHITLQDQNVKNVTWCSLCKTSSLPWHWTWLPARGSATSGCCRARKFACPRICPRQASSSGSSVPVHDQTQGLCSFTRLYVM